MQDILNFILEHPIEIALPIVVAVLVNGFKKAFKKFFKQHPVGFRLMPFLPVVLGTLGGFMLTAYSMSARLMIGAALGGLSHLVYKMIKTSLASKVSLVKQMKRKNIDWDRWQDDEEFMGRYSDYGGPYHG